MSRLLAIGDIHGRHDLLDALLAKVSPTRDDRLIFLGDYVDRGPQSRGVVERLLVLRDDLPATVFLRGNHEQLLLDALAEAGRLPGWSPLRSQSQHYRAEAAASDLLLWMANGGGQTLASYGIRPGTGPLPESLLPTDHLDFLQQTILWHSAESWLFIHAGADPALPLEAQDPYLLLWGRQFPPLPDSSPRQVVGHTPTRDGMPHWDGGRLYLDTGGVFGGALSCYDLNHETFWQVS